MPFGTPPNNLDETGFSIYAMFDFDAEVGDEISFKCGQQIRVLETDKEYSDGWWVGVNEDGKEGLFPESYTSWARPIAPGIAPISAATGETKVGKQSQPGNTPSNTPKDDMKATMTEIQDAINEFNVDDPHKGSNNSLNDDSQDKQLLAPIVEQTNSKTSSQITVSTDDNTDDDDDEVNAKARSLLAKKNAQANGSNNAPTSLEFGEDSDEDTTPHTATAPRNELLVPSKDPAEVIPESPLDAMMPRQPVQSKPSGLKNTYTPTGEVDDKQDFKKPSIPSSYPLDAHDPTPTIKPIENNPRDSGSAQWDNKREKHDSRDYKHDSRDYKHDSNSTQKASKPISHSSLPPVNTAIANTQRASQETSKSSNSRNSYENVEQWSVERVIEWAVSKGFDTSIKDKLREHEISGDVLIEMDAASLKEIDIVAFGKRVKIANAIKELRSQAGLDVQHSQPQSASTGRPGSETSSMRNASGGNYTTSVASPVDLNEDMPSRPTSFAQRTGSGLLSHKNSGVLEQTPEEPEREHDQVIAVPEKVPNQTDSPKAGSATASLKRAFSGSTTHSPVMHSPRSSAAKKHTSDTSAFFGVGSKGNPRKPAPRYSGASNDTNSPEEKSRKPFSASRLLGSKRSIRNMNGSGASTRSSLSPQTAQNDSQFVDTISISSDKRRSVVDITNFQEREGTALQKIGRCDCKGWMKKRGDRYGWKMRYFVLKGSQLFYLKNENDKQLKGFIQLNGFRVMNDESNSSRNNFAFKIVHESEKDVHYFASEEKSVSREWMNALMKASIVRDVHVSSCTIPTIPLDQAQTMFPPPRPPSPGSRERVQRANVRDNPDSLSPEDARVLMAGAPDTPNDKRRMTTSSFGNLSSSFGNDDREKDF
ncbi:PH-domain-containing protein [Wallemia mellicola]|uniref:PH-domain-containing protein n=1 Tax=Wallemia mellicola TaxID=1708541 RepID=A0A4T0NIE2_9BASI|nr:PH-domain-containing protein [Wallemia mellicola]